MAYFFLRDFFHYHTPAFFSRKNRRLLNCYLSLKHFSVGDFLEVFFQKESLSFIFGGHCLSIKGKSLKNSNNSVLLRGSYQNIFVECFFCLFLNRVVISTMDHKRRFFFNRRSKFFFNRKK